MLFKEKPYHVKKREEDTPRINALKERFFADKLYIDTQRALLLTESYKETEGQPMVLRRALGFQKIMENLAVVIQDNELIVGAQNGSSNRSANVFPECNIDFIIEEIDTFETRATDKFIVTPQARDDLMNTVIPYWKGKTLRENMLATLPEEARRQQLAENPVLNGWCAFNNGPGHYVPDYEDMLRRGMKDKRREILEVMESIDFCKKEGIEQYNFLKAELIVLDAVITFAHRYADKAREMAASETDETRKKELIRIAETCEWVPENPPRTFYEATQFVWFIELIMQIEVNGVSISPGSFDRYMLQYYQADLASGRETQESICEILGCFWIKLAEMVILYDTQTASFIANFSMAEHMSLGGMDKYGRDATNELSYICLQTQMDVGLFQPNMSVKWHNRCDDNFIKEALRVVSVRNAIPQIINDEVFIPSLLNRGIPLDEARCYAPAGCSENQIPGKTASLMMIWVSDMKVLECALNNGRDELSDTQLGLKTGEPEDFKTFEEVYDAYRKQLQYFYKWGSVIMNTEANVHTRILPLPFMSLTNRTCIPKATEIWAGGAEYYWTSMIGVCGMGNVGNSLYAIKKVCFEDKLYTLKEVVDACNNNFEGAEDMRQVLLNLPKYGNDIDEVDMLTSDAMNLSYELSQKYIDPQGHEQEFKDPRGGKLLRSMWPSYLTVSANSMYGSYCGASPDGRLARTPLNDSISPTQGTDVVGLTAALNSVSKVDQVPATGGIIFNTKFTPEALSTEENLDDAVEMVKAYFRRSGGQIQFQVTDHRTLRAAQDRPEQYKDLMVRITGYAALFVEISTDVQNELISRTQYEAV